MDLALAFLNGIVVSACILITLYCLKLSKSFDNAKIAATKELRDLLSEISKTHNELTENLMTTDSKLSQMNLVILGIEDKLRINKPRGF